MSDDSQQSNEETHAQVKSFGETALEPAAAMAKEVGKEMVTTAIAAELGPFAYVIKPITDGMVDHAVDQTKDKAADHMASGVTKGMSK